MAASVVVFDHESAAGSLQMLGTNHGSGTLIGRDPAASQPSE